MNNTTKIIEVLNELDARPNTAEQAVSWHRVVSKRSPIGKGLLWAMELHYPLEGELDFTNYAALQLKYAMDIDEMVYIGDDVLGVQGLLTLDGCWKDTSVEQAVKDLGADTVLVPSAWMVKNLPIIKGYFPYPCVMLHDKDYAVIYKNDPAVVGLPYSELTRSGPVERKKQLVVTYSARVFPLTVDTSEIAYVKLQLH